MVSTRFYADSSVYGGIGDEKWSAASEDFLAAVATGAMSLVVSGVVERELRIAPLAVRQAFDRILSRARIVDISDDAHALADAYIGAGILTPKYRSDALHVAIATIERCTLVSWNFRHMLASTKRDRYVRINAENGYPTIRICTPHEALRHATGI